MQLYHIFFIFSLYIRFPAPDAFAAFLFAQIPGQPFSFSGLLESWVWITSMYAAKMMTAPVAMYW